MGYTKIISYANTLEIYEYERDVVSLMGRRNAVRKSDSCDENLESRGEYSFSQRKLGKRSDNARRASLAFKRIVTSNLGGSALPLLVTLTYRDNFTDLSGAYRHYSTFVQSLRYQFGKTFRYICVPEFQKRGAVHFHALFWGLPEEVFLLERQNRRIASTWGHGYVYLKETDGNDALAGYLSKYFTKAFTDPRLRNQKCYTASRNVKRPLIQKGSFPVAEVLEQFGVVSEPVVDRKYLTNWLGEGRCRIYKTDD